MSRATPVRSRHVVVTMMARSITVERSVPALPGLARVSGLGMGMGMGMGRPPLGAGSPATRKPIDLGNGSDSNGAFDFMGGAKPGDAFDFVGSEIAKNKKSI
mmetsp:Transcript_24043/g.71240  ORF Transcript_24043/g.71240 Transcript_24043/m.71240 type:complete len:102 (-) Transcript_24043:153-458(-)